MWPFFMGELFHLKTWCYQVNKFVFINLVRAHWSVNYIDFKSRIKSRNLVSNNPPPPLWFHFLSHYFSFFEINKVFLYCKSTLTKNVGWILVFVECSMIYIKEFFFVTSQLPPDFWFQTGLNTEVFQWCHILAHNGKSRLKKKLYGDLCS